MRPLGNHFSVCSLSVSLSFFHLFRFLQSFARKKKLRRAAESREKVEVVRVCCKRERKKVCRVQIKREESERESKKRYGTKLWGVVKRRIL